MLRAAFDPYEGVLHTARGVTSDEDARRALWEAVANGELGVVVERRVYLFVEVTGKPLTTMEREVVLATARACSGKEIAYALGVAASTVSGALSSAATKVHLDSPAALARFVRALVVAPIDDCASGLSAIEREVALGVVAGKSNHQIACERGRSIHTIANQVASILRKTGSPSRYVLRVRYNNG